MAANDISRTLDAGREAFARYAWSEAYDILSSPDLAGALEPRDLEALGEAAWWMGRLDECISARERAFAGHLDAGKRRRAAAVALAIAKDYFAKGGSSVGSGWIKRGERLLADEGECVEQGWLERLKAVIAFEGQGDAETALEHARRALDIGTRFGDRDLQALALHDEGRMLLSLGSVEEGLALTDEATVAAVSGELSPYITGAVYCNTITICEELADYRRAGEWTEAAKRWCDRQAISGFPGLCRVHRASILRIRGAWPEAEEEARRACDELRDFNLGYAGAGLYEIGEIRLRMGDLHGADEAFRQAHELGHEPQPGLALLRLAEGRPDAALACLEQALADESRALHRARLLPAQVEIALASGDIERAQAAADELEAIAAAYGSDALAAGGRTARAKVDLAEGDAARAIQAARRAFRAWQGLDAPYEATRARMVLAEAYAVSGNAENCVLELRAAASAFDRLGALADAATARARLAELGDAGTAALSRPATRTFMFTDIVRSTGLVEAIGDEAWADLVAWHDRTLRAYFSENDGEEVDHAGDGFFVCFPTAEKALECAVAIQRTLAEHRKTHGFAPQVRIGLHATEARRTGAAYRGRGVHEAARIASLAGSGEIVASRATAEQANGRFRATLPRAVTLKGISEPVEVVTVDWR